MWKNRIVGYDTKPANQFTANPLNFRRHPALQREALRGLLGEVGWVGAVLENTTTGNLIDGHARIEEALSKGEETPIPYLKVELTEAEEKLVLASYDPISALATTDKEVLETLLQQTKSSSDAVDKMLADLAKQNGVNLGGEVKDVEPEIDRAAELLKKWKVERGQVWEVGRHRLMCGDSASDKDVQRLTRGELIDGVCTDPPYEMPASACATILSAWAGCSVVLAGDRLAFELAQHLTFRLALIWKHRKAKLTWAAKAKHQPIMLHAIIGIYTATRNGKTGWRLPRPDFKSVIECETEYEDREMGHGKAAEIFREMMAGFSWKIVGDPFAGTAATLLACEATGRNWRGMECEPSTVAVALERCERAGLRPTLAANVQIAPGSEHLRSRRAGMAASPA